MRKQRATCSALHDFHGKARSASVQTVSSGTGQHCAKGRGLQGGQSPRLKCKPPNALIARMESKVLCCLELGREMKTLVQNLFEISIYGPNKIIKWK